MKKRKMRLYNVFFPVWLLWIFPVTWLIILPANFLVDLLVVFLTLKCLKVPDIKQNLKSVLLKVWLFGFLADLAGSALMILSNLINFSEGTPMRDWWYDTISYPVYYQPFTSLWSFLWVAVSTLVAGVCIYFFNYKISLKKSTLEDGQKKKLSLWLSILTAPYVFFLPTMWFYR